MIRRPSRPARLALAALLGLLVVAGVTTVPTSPARADSAPADPALPATPATVSADALPTVQVDGVVWSQVVVGNTVYAAGQFTRARPAGSPAGVNETVRNNLLAYDIRTGDLITGFAPDLNAQALTVAASPDGSRLYVGGDFTAANGQNRYRLATYSTATGALLDDFKPVFESEVRAVVATASTVYVGGIDWGNVSGGNRDYLAAFSASTGQLLPWAPAVDQQVNALALVNNNSAVVVAGNFLQLNGRPVNSLGEVDATTGATLPFAASTATRNGGPDSAILSLSTDSDTVYASGFSWNGSGNFEGVLAVAPSGGAVKWVNDCHGDTYSVFATGTVEYVASHEHICENIGGFWEDGGATPIGHRATAFSKAATGHVGEQTGNFIGQPSPTLLDWFPYLEPGTYTGQYQAAWSVSGNADYVVYGGEFPSVNNGSQQGLVRFAVPRIAPNKVGPEASAGLQPKAVSTAGGTVRLSWQTTWDEDNASLTYDVFRSDKPGVPVYSTTGTSTFWNMPMLSFLDRSAPAGTSVTYRVTARDAFGNSVTGDPTSITVASTGTAKPDDYATAVINDGPTSYWRLDETSGTTMRDTVGTFDATRTSGVTLGRTGALSGRADTAASFSGTSTGSVGTQAAVNAPDVMTMEAWFSTTSKTGGQVVGFGDSRAGTLSGMHDRFIALNGSGQVSFNIYPRHIVTVSSAAGYNDGKWHHVVATMGPAGSSLFLDGKLAGTASDGTSGQHLTGYWRIGGDGTWDGSGPWLQGTIDDVAVYSRVLTAAQVASHSTLGRTTPAANATPTASFTSSVTDQTVSVDGSGSTDPDGTVASWAWDFGDGSSGTGKTASHTYTAGGTYAVKLTVTDNGGAAATATRSVTVVAPPGAGTVLARDAFGRQLAAGWGTADVGGTWTIAGPAANASVSSGYGRLTAAAGVDVAAALPFSARDVSVTGDVTLEKAPTGNGAFYSLGARNNGSTRYNAQLNYTSDGGVALSLSAVVNGAETQLAYTPVLGNYTPGTVLRLRFEAVGSGTTTLRARVWPSTTAEPTTWQVSASDTTGALQGSGGLYAELYTSKAATTAAAVRLANLSVTAPGAAAPPPANVTPTAAFTAAPAGLALAVDASSSTDPDGSIASYAWTFGDGASGTGKTASHTYAAAGTYQVGLTVTDNSGGTGTATKSVTVATPPPPPPAGGALASDAFGREVAGGWGSADVGGAWTITGAASNTSVTAGSGRLTAGAGVTTGASLGISARDVALQADVTLQKAPAGGGSFVSLGTRQVGSSLYETIVYYAPDGSVTLVLATIVSGNETDVASYTLPGTFAAGTSLTVRMETSGSGTTALRAKAWPTGTTEPAAWQVTASDTTAALQNAGGVYVELYDSGKATVTQTLQIDNLWVGAAGTKP
ncbi:MAG: Conserved secreted protein of unknown function, putative domain [Frankiales bacterium]|nr:Conserved secreted protein of unknown function, putative domain [Frankiales bacterium]